jgi:hypothetical protein
MDCFEAWSDELHVSDIVSCVSSYDCDHNAIIQVSGRTNYDLHATNASSDILDIGYTESHSTVTFI